MDHLYRLPPKCVPRKHIKSNINLTTRIPLDIVEKSLHFAVAFWWLRRVIRGLIRVGVCIDYPHYTYFNNSSGTRA